MILRNGSLSLLFSLALLLSIPLVGCDDKGSAGDTASDETSADADAPADGIGVDPANQLTDNMLRMFNGVEPIFRGAQSAEDFEAAAPALDEIFETLYTDVEAYFEAGGTLAGLQSVMNANPEVKGRNDALTALIAKRRTENPEVGGSIDDMMKKKMDKLSIVISRNASIDEIQKYQEDKTEGAKRQDAEESAGQIDTANGVSGE